MAQDAAPSATPRPTPRPPAPTTVPLSRTPEWEARVTKTNKEAAARAKEIGIVFEGDSITSAWPSKGKAIWQGWNKSCGTVDFAIGGDRTENVLWRIEKGQLDGLNPKLVFLMIGTNNIKGSSAQEIANGVEAIIKEYRKRLPEAVIVLQAIFPRSEKPDDELRSKAAAVNALLAKLADGKKVVYMDFGKDFLKPDGTIGVEMMPDFLHPTSKGYDIWAKAIQPVIDTHFPGKSSPTSTPGAPNP